MATVLVAKRRKTEMGDIGKDLRERMIPEVDEGAV